MTPTIQYGERKSTFIELETSYLYFNYLGIFFLYLQTCNCLVSVTACRPEVPEGKLYGRLWLIGTVLQASIFSVFQIQTNRKFVGLFRRNLNEMCLGIV